MTRTLFWTALVSLLACLMLPDVLAQRGGRGGGGAGGNRGGGGGGRGGGGMTAPARQAGPSPQAARPAGISPGGHAASPGAPGRSGVGTPGAQRPGGGFAAGQPGGPGGSGPGVGRPGAAPGGIGGPGTGNRPGAGSIGRPGEVGRPGAGPGNVGRPGAGPGDVGRPGGVGGPGGAGPGVGRPGDVGRPGGIGGPGDVGRPGGVGGPGGIGRPGDVGRPGGIGRPGDNTHVGDNTRIGDNNNRIGDNTRIRTGDVNINTGNINTGNVGVRHVSNTAIANHAVGVRGGFNHYGLYGADWNRGHPGAWFAAGWATGYAWRACTYPQMISYVGVPAQPVYYDYGTSVVYQGDTVYVNGDPAGTQQEYYNQAATIAQAGMTTKPTPQEEWMPLGVFALNDGTTDAVEHVFQLAVNKQGIVRGNYTNVAADTTEPVYGSVDKKTQRIAWTIADSKTPVYEAGIANLSKPETTILIHNGQDTPPSQWYLVRLEQPQH